MQVERGEIEVPPHPDPPPRGGGSGWGWEVQRLRTNPVLAVG